MAEHVRTYIFRGLDANGGRKLRTDTQDKYTYIKKTEKTFKNEQRSKDAAAKKDLIQVE